MFRWGKLGFPLNPHVRHLLAGDLKMDSQPPPVGKPKLGSRKERDRQTTCSDSVSHRGWFRNLFRTAKKPWF